MFKFCIKKIIPITILILLNISNVYSQWVESIGESAGLTSGNSVAADNSGNVYATGISFVNEDNFQGSGQDEEDTVTNFIQRRIFIHKYDNLGNILWTNFLATDSIRAWSNGIGIDDNQNVFISGFYQDTLKYDGDNYLYNEDEPTMYLAKYNSDGSFAWIIDVNVTGADTIVPFSLAVDGTGNCFIGGAFQGNITLGSHSLASTENQFFLAKFNSAGNIQWVESGENADQGAYIADIALDNNSIIIAGNFKGNLEIAGNNFTAAGGSSNIFLAKYADGINPTLDFAKSEVADTVQAISVDKEGNILLTGKIFNPASFTNASETINITVNSGLSAMFLAKYEPDGEVIWAKSGEVSLGMASGNGVGADDENNIYLTGIFGGQGTASNLTIDGISSVGFMEDDLYYAKFNADGDIAWLEVAADSLNDRALDLAVGNANQIFITGNYQDSIAIGNDITGREFAGRKGFVAKIDVCPDLITSIVKEQESICAGETNRLIATANPNYNYQWFVDKSLMDGATSDFLQVSDSGEYVVRVFDTASLCSKTSNRISINPYPVPSPVVSLNSDSIICQGDTINLSTIGNVKSDFQWLQDGNPTNLADTVTTLKVFETGLYQIRETNQYGCAENSNAIAIKVLEIPDPEITIEGDSVFCIGESTRLRVTSNPDYSYQWFSGSDSLENNTDYSIEITSSGQYKVGITNLGLCTSESMLKTITAIDLPEAIITPGGETDFCEEAFVTLYASTGVNLEYSWFKNDQSLDDESMDRYTAIAGGNYHVTITNSYGCMRTSDKIPVSVFENPVAEFEVLGSSALCDGDSVQLTTTAFPGYDLQWINYASPIGEANESTLWVSFTGTYSLLVTDENGCKDQSEAVMIEVNPLPDAYILPLGPTTFCEGQEVSLSANGGNNLIYSWYKNDEVINNANNLIYKAKSAGSYRVKVTNENDCFYLSDSVKVTVNTIPDATVTNDRDLILCEGEILNLNAIDDPNNSYQWFKNGFKIDSARTSNLAVSSTGTYFLSVLSSALCSAEGQEFDVIVKDNRKPIINFTENNLSTSYFIEYQWIKDGSDIPGANQQIYHFDQKGNYAVEIVNENGCVNSSESLFLCSPAPVISPNNDVLTASRGSSFQWYKDGEPIEGAIQQKYAVLEAGNYAVAITNPDGCTSLSRYIKRCFPHPNIEVSPDFTLVSSVGINYQWYKDGNLIPGATNQVYQAIKNGLYSVAVLSFEECEAISDPARVLVTGIEQKIASGLEEIVIYPNPANQELNIQFGNSRFETVKVMLLDVLGKKVYSNKLIPGKDPEYIDVKNLKNGIYYCIFISNDIKTNRKITISR